MDEDSVTADDAAAFWASLTQSERSVLRNIDARERNQHLLAKLERHGMLFWAADEGNSRAGTAAQSTGVAQRDPVDLTGRYCLARELVRVLDSNCGDA